EGDERRHRAKNQSWRVVQNLEAVRRSWQRAEAELKRFKELLVKSDVAKAALEIQLKHARNQVDVEMRKRHKVEERQMQLMCDILVQDGKFNVSLNDDQKNLLAKLNQQGANATLRHSTKSRLSVIDESSFLSHSDISYDRTEDYVVGYTHTHTDRTVPLIRGRLSSYIRTWTPR
uniref:Uncharacterized protein n=1 Tax=Xiphophorus couchianus TaxID=32473 RepID=A0A3B5L8U0_9TELE